MSIRSNCWQVMQCGREPGGARTAEIGVCPAAEAVRFDGVNGGVAAGRFCWVVGGSYCPDQVLGQLIDQLDCTRCPFLAQVAEEEGDSILLSLSDLARRGLDELRGGGA